MQGARLARAAVRRGHSAHGAPLSSSASHDPRVNQRTPASIRAPAA
jgi:hypothetical protein